MFVSPDTVMGLLAQAATEYVMPRFRSLAEEEVWEKSPGNVVTAADMEAEIFLRRELEALLPGSVVMGEEGVSENPDSLNTLATKNKIWLVDPVDGTHNFTKGSTTFCLMVALVQAGETVLACIHSPATEETAVAEQGSGAWLNGERLRMPEPPTDLSTMIGQVGFSHFPLERRKTVREEAKRRFQSPWTIGCAGHDFLRQAQGERHFALYRRLWPWDHAPGVLLLQEAGGAIGRLENGALPNPLVREYGLLTTANDKTWHRLKRLFDSW